MGDFNEKIKETMFFVLDLGAHTDTYASICTDGEGRRRD